MQPYSTSNMPRSVRSQVEVDELVVGDAELVESLAIPAARAAPGGHQQVALSQQQLREAGAVLAGDAGDQRSLRHRLPGFSGPTCVAGSLTVQEAVLSSKIEGTQVTMGDVLEADADGDALNSSVEKRADIEDVRNYRMALGFASNAISDRPLSEHLLRETHALLMRGVRGQGEEPGS